MKKRTRRSLLFNMSRQLTILEAHTLQLSIFQKEYFNRFTQYKRDDKIIFIHNKKEMKGIITYGDYIHNTRSFRYFVAPLKEDGINFKRRNSISVHVENIKGLWN